MHFVIWTGRSFPEDRCIYEDDDIDDDGENDNDDDDGDDDNDGVVGKFEEEPD